MADNLKLVEKLLPLIANCDTPGSGGGLYEHEALGVFVREHQEAIIKALRRPPAQAGPAVLQTVEEVIYHHFYPGPLGGSKNRLANALVDAFPALQGHEA